MSQQKITMYSENGCLLCREAEGTLRLLLGDTVFDDHFRVVKMTFDLSSQKAFSDCTGSAIIPKFFLGDFQTGTPLAGSCSPRARFTKPWACPSRVFQRGKAPILWCWAQAPPG